MDYHNILSQINLGVLLPEIVVCAGAFIILLADLLVPAQKKQITAGLTLLAALCAGAVLLRMGIPDTSITAYSGLFILDGYAVFFKLIFLLASVLTVLCSVRYLKEEQETGGEYYPLVLFAVLGQMLMVSGSDLVTIYVGLEMMALSVYVLVAYLKKDKRSNEAALKYFILGAFSSAIFLYGISLFFGATGSTRLTVIYSALTGAEGGLLAKLGLIAMLVGLGFKVAAVPFHVWTPDAYEGAPTPITGFMSVAPKAAAFAVLLRILIQGLYPLRSEWFGMLWVICVATMTLGNFAALAQKNIKRMLAYSSIAHAGYMLIGVLAAVQGAEKWAIGGVMIYILFYAFMNLGAFAVITMLRRKQIAGDMLSDFKGLVHRSPMSFLVMLIFMLSLAGIPPTAGFVGKFIVFGAAVKSGMYSLLVIAVLNTVVSLCYYLRVVVLMFMHTADDVPEYGYSPGITLTLAISALFTIGLGVYPNPVIDWVWRAILTLP